MLETIRQFAEEQLAAIGDSVKVRDRHAAYFAQQAITHWALWEGPSYRQAAEWVVCLVADLAEWHCPDARQCRAALASVPQACRTPNSADRQRLMP